MKDIDTDDIERYVSEKQKKKPLEVFDKYKKEILFSSNLSESITVDNLDPSNKIIDVFDDCFTA